MVYDKVRRFALAEGTTKTAIAGYLYFPQYAKRKKSDEIELKYAKDDVTANLAFSENPETIRNAPPMAMASSRRAIGRSLPPVAFTSRTRNS